MQILANFWHFDLASNVDGQNLYSVLTTPCTASACTTLQIYYPIHFDSSMNEEICRSTLIQILIDDTSASKASLEAKTNFELCTLGTEGNNYRLCS